MVSYSVYLKINGVYYDNNIKNSFFHLKISHYFNENFSKVSRPLQQIIYCFQFQILWNYYYITILVNIIGNITPTLHTLNHYILQQTAFIFIQISIVSANLEKILLTSKSFFFCVYICNIKFPVDTESFAIQLMVITLFKKFINC